MKYTYPIAFTVTSLAWGLLEFPKGYHVAGVSDHAMASLRWGLDYLLKCKLADDKVVALVGADCAFLKILVAVLLSLNSLMKPIH